MIAGLFRAPSSTLTHTAVKVTWINAPSEPFGSWKVFLISTKEERAALRHRQTIEFKSNQKDLRDSIAQSERLVDEADAMIRRHRDESDVADGEKAATHPPPK